MFVFFLHCKHFFSELLRQKLKKKMTALQEIGRKYCIQIFVNT